LWNGLFASGIKDPQWCWHQLSNQQQQTFACGIGFTPIVPVKKKISEVDFSDEEFWNDPIFKNFIPAQKPVKSGTASVTEKPVSPTVKTLIEKPKAEETVQKKVVVLPPKISIKSKVNDKSEDFIISQVEKPRDEFDKEKLLIIIDEYAISQQKLNKKSWAFTVKAGEPAIKANDTIVFIIFNTTQEVEFNKNREEFTQHLRDKLNNQFVVIQTELKEKEEVITKTINPMEKFDNMVKENPLLLELKKTFSLDL